MIPQECKRLAEVDFPIAVVSKHSAREKSIRHGHPSTLHLWWARRPLAACRAILLGLLLPDTCDTYCPEDFKEKARELLPKVQGKIGPKDEDLRQALLKFIGDFSNWHLSSNQTYLEVGRGLVKAAHPEETPLVVDPFAGGGSIPLEALRVGCETFASDLNPVATLILKVMLEDIPRHGPELADELHRVGKEIREAAEKELKEFYPSDPDGSKPIAYLWARTVRCEAPNCGAEIPLVRSFWLCKKSKRKQALRYKVIREERAIDFEVFEPQDDNEVPNGTVAQAKATCLSCGTVVSPDRLRAQLISQEGGGDVIFDERGNRTGGARLMTVVTLNHDEKKRRYRLPTGEDYAAVWMAVKELPKVTCQAGPGGLSPVPSETFHNIRPSPNARGLSAVTRYGINRFSQLFVHRQLLSIVTFCKGIHLRYSLASSVNTLLGLIFSRMVDYCSAQSRWDPSQERNVNSFGRQALPMLWDFSELVPFRDCVGAWTSMQNSVIRVTKEFQNIDPTTGIENADATEHPLSDSSAHIWFTDPPYYDSIPFFGEESISVAGFRIEEQARRDPQMRFDFAVGAERAIAPDLPAGALAQAGIKARRPKKKMPAESAAKQGLPAGASAKAGTTTLDRIHAAMLLQANGQTNALRALLKAEQDRGPDFIRLANALSALYPKQSEEKRLLDAMLLAMPRV